MVPDSIPIAHHPLFGAWGHIGELVEEVGVDDMVMEYWLPPHHHNDVLERVVGVEHAPASVALGIQQCLV